MSWRAPLALALSAAVHVGALALLAGGEAPQPSRVEHAPVEIGELVRVDVVVPGPVAPPRPASAAPSAPPAPMVARASPRQPRAAPSPPAGPETAPAPPMLDEGRGGPPSPPPSPVVGVHGLGQMMASAAAPSEGRGGGADATLSAIHARLRAAAARCYPAAARRYRLQGVVEVSFCVGQGGEVARSAKEVGSGSAVLDRAALDCVIPGAAPYPGDARCYRVPVRFGP